MQSNRLVFDGVTAYVQGDIFYPGAPSLAPVRGVVPPIYVVGVGYFNRDAIPVVQGRALVQSQQAVPLGLGVQAGSMFAVQPLAVDNTITGVS